MSTIRKMRDKYQGLVRVKGHPYLAKSFKKFSDAQQWAMQTEIKLRREDAGILKIKYPSFKDMAVKYMLEITPTKRSSQDETYTIRSLCNEGWAEYPINRVTPAVIGKYRDNQLKKVSGSSVCRRLDVISTIFTSIKKEWGYDVKNPVLAIRRPKRSEPRNRRLSDKEINLLLKGNRTSELLRTIIQVALETGMRQGEILRIHPDHIKGKTLLIPIAKTNPRTIALTTKALDILKRAAIPFNITQDNLQKQFQKLCKHYGIKDAHFHDLRKNNLTDLMLKKNLTVAETMLQAGHSDPRMLLRVYNNLRVEDVAKKLD